MANNKHHPLSKKKFQSVFSFSKVLLFLYLFLFQSLLIIYHSIILTIRYPTIRYSAIRNWINSVFLCNISDIQQSLRFLLRLSGMIFHLGSWFWFDYVPISLLASGSNFQLSFYLIVGMIWMTNSSNILSGFHTHLKGFIERYVNHFT